MPIVAMVPKLPFVTLSLKMPIVAMVPKLPFVTPETLTARGSEQGRTDGKSKAVLGWHYLTNATCLIRPRLFYGCFVVSRIAIIRYVIRHF